MFNISLSEPSTVQWLVLYITYINVVLSSITVASPNIPFEFVVLLLFVELGIFIVSFVDSIRVTALRVWYIPAPE